MAKRKGKSRHREKGWERLHRSQELRSEDAESYRRLTQRRVRLPGQEQGAPIFAEPADQASPTREQLTGMVVQLYPGGAVVRCQSYGDLLCGLSGTFRPPPNSSALAVGDVVTLELTPEASGLILQRMPRRSALSRPQPMSAKRRDRYEGEVFEKVIAANMDQLVVVASAAQPPLRRRLLDRYLIIAERGGLPPVLVVNKTDLAGPDEQLLADYVELGMPSLRCSVRTGAGLQEFKTLLTGRSSILAGASGVGKSSLLNALHPGLELTTREVRAADRRGRHTTTAATLYELPFGATVVDTPGIRELGIEIGAEELPWYFPEIARHAPQCRFRNCTHTHEPDCAVRQAVTDGTVASHRYQSYLRLLESLGPH